MTWAEATRRTDDPVALLLGQPYARFQGDPRTHPVRALSQKVQVPFALGEARLAFRAHITASRTDPQRDRLTIQVLEPGPGSAPPRVLAAGLTLTGADAWEDWVEYSIPLQALAWLNDPKEVEVRLEYRPAHADAVFRIQELRLLGSDAPQARVVPDPPKVRLAPGERAAAPFTARIAGALDQRVTWKLREAGGGTLTGQGAYTAPDQPGWYHAVATAVADPRLEAEVSIQVRAREPAPEGKGR